jgi:GT2 family glycosyltransferase
MAHRPLWSVMVPVFNGAHDLERSLRSVLHQDPGPDVMQIEVVDDCSTKDDPASVVRDIAGDRVSFHRHDRNVGHARNFNTCIARSKGKLVHILHADDWVADGFYSGMGALLEDAPDATMAFCRHTVMDPDGQVDRVSPLEAESAGVIPDWLPRIASRLTLQPPSVVVRRSSYEKVGGFDTRMKSCGEDWEMWVRLALLGPVAYLPTPLAFYQDTVGSLTKRSVRSGQNVRDVRNASDIIATYLPPDIGPALFRKARISWAEWGLYWSWKQAESGDYRAALTAMREALLCSRDKTILESARKIALYGLRKAAHEKLSRRG